MEHVTQLKLVIVGDGACGKTSILIVYSRNEFPKDHLPTIFDTYIKQTEHEGSKVRKIHKNSLLRE